MNKARAHCLKKVNDEREWKFRDDLRPGSIFGLTHFINKHVDKDVTDVCILLCENNFAKGTTKFNKSSYREFEQTLYVSEKGSYQLVASGWILSDLLPGSELEPKQFYIKIIKIN